MVDDLSRSARIFPGVGTIKTACLESADHKGMLFTPSRDSLLHLAERYENATFESPTIKPRFLTIYGGAKWRIIDSRPQNMLED